MCSDAVNEVVEFARRQLKDILDLSGRVLYSGIHTLQPGDLYVLGHNPGGCPKEHAHETIGSVLDELPDKTVNNYLDESWEGRKVGTHPLQLRIKWLTKTLGFNLRDVASSNLLFSRSRRAKHIDFQEHVWTCWPVHERMLRIVQPKMVIAFGNAEKDTPYSFLRAQFGGIEEKPIPSGHDNWQCRSFVATNGLTVIGLPHLSIYKIDAHEAVADWVKSKLRTK